MKVSLKVSKVSLKVSMCTMKVSLKVREGGKVVVFVSGKNGERNRRLGNSLRKCGVQE
jgi:hypothetical protein